MENTMKMKAETPVSFGFVVELVGGCLEISLDLGEVNIKFDAEMSRP